MATVQRVQGGGLPSTDYEGRGQLTPVVFVVEGHSIGEDPTTVVGTDGTTPLRVNASIVVGGKTYHCDRVESSKSISDTATEVTCYFSTDRRFGYPNRQDNPDEQGYYNWDRSFQLYQETVPGYQLDEEASSQGGGVINVAPNWVPDDFTIEKSFMVFSVSVRIDALEPAELTDILDLTADLDGEIHILPMFRKPRQWNEGPLRALYPATTGNVFQVPGEGRVWVLQEPTLNGPGLTPDTGLTYTIITYTWLSDKGTWNDVPVGMRPIDAERCSLAPPRPPWHRYMKSPSKVNPSTGEPNEPAHLGHPLGAPKIVTVPSLVMATSNPYWNPTGYRDLPGNPIA